MILKLILSLSFYLIAINLLVGQNLVPNYSFENNTSKCPSSQGDLFTTDWYTPNGQTTDFFTPCGLDKWYSSPDNSENFGYQLAATGTNYVGIRAWDDQWGPAIREYIGVKLTDSLKKCKLYTVSFKVSLANGPKTKWAISDLGLFLSKDKKEDFGSVLYVNPQIRREKGDFISEAGKWETISGFYFARGGEQFITIGNFESYENTNKLDVVPGKINGSAYYYIDDVEVYETGIDSYLQLDTTFCESQEVLYESIIDADSMMVIIENERKVFYTNTFLMNKNGNYFIEEFKNGCSTHINYQSNRVNCSGKIKMPNFVSPNSDFKNDIFEPAIYENITSATLKVYNRWGRIIFTSEEIKWDPSEESAGVYYYEIIYIDRENKNKEAKGWVFVTR